MLFAEKHSVRVCKLHLERFETPLYEKGIKQNPNRPIENTAAVSFWMSNFFSVWTIKTKVTFLCPHNGVSSASGSEGPLFKASNLDKDFKKIEL